ncbi:MAG: signal peptidase I [Thaumarchaeota archaeon]|nr:signal peptidase I [Nitrososphaerota archaeon]
MRLPGRRASVYGVGFVLFLVVFAFILLTYTRRVDGVSMLPTFEEGDLVGVQTVSINDVHVGDIIVYGPPCSRGPSIIHRVVASEAEGLITQGDDRRTNPGTDQTLGIATGPITQECLVGKVVVAVPYVERLASLPYGANYILASLILLVLIITEVQGRRGPKKVNDTVAAPEPK